MSSSIPSIPPWDICAPGTDISPAVSEWLCENYYWPVIHCMSAFILQYYIRKWWKTLLILYMYETLEAIIQVSSGSLLGEVPEGVGGALISDVINGIIGITMQTLLAYILNFNYSRTPKTFVDFKLQWLYLLIQLILFASSTLIYWLPDSYFDDGVLSWGYMILNVVFPLLFYLFSIWNRYELKKWSHIESVYITRYAKSNSYTNTNNNDKRLIVNNDASLFFVNYISHRYIPMINSGDPILNGPTYKTVSVQHSIDHVNVDPKHENFVHIIMGLYIFAFMATFQVRYTSVFVMLLFHSAFLFIVLIIAAIIKTQTYYNPMKKSTEENFAKK